MRNKVKSPVKCCYVYGGGYPEIIFPVRITADRAAWALIKHTGYASTVYLILTIVMLIAYLYFFVNSHIRVARIDRQVPVPRHSSGTVRVKDLRQLKQQVTGAHLETELKLALLYLLFSNYIALTYFAILFLLVATMGI